MLPNLIEIKPLSGPVNAEITVPGSKSITNRALILAALAQGRTTLTGALWSEDTQVMVDCLRKLGFRIEVTEDSNEFCNRTIVVQGLGGKIPNAGHEGKPLDLSVGNAGTAARFLAAFVCLGDGVYRLHGVPRMHERPQAALFAALRELGFRVESENANDKLPVVIHGQGLANRKPANCSVSIEKSSQFASALLLSSKTAGWKINVIGENADESPYVAMTSRLMEIFPQDGGNFQIEPDASSGSYFAAVSFLSFGEQLQYADVRVKNWPRTSFQIDDRFPSIFKELSKNEIDMVSRSNQLGDSIITAIVLAPEILSRFTSDSHISFTDLGRLRLQECERVVALRTELTKCGAKVIEEGDTLIVYPSSLHGAEIETYEDHRMAMCFAILGLKVPGLKIRNPACVKKTFPNFFQKLAAAPPHGLGAVIINCATGSPLTHAELFAD